MAATIRLSQQHSCSLDHLVGEREQLVHVLLTELCLDTQCDSQKVPADISSRRSEIAALCSQCWRPHATGPGERLHDCRYESRPPVCPSRPAPAPCLRLTHRRGRRDGGPSYLQLKKLQEGLFRV